MGRAFRATGQVAGVWSGRGAPASLDYTKRMNERNMKLIEIDNLTALLIEGEPGRRPYKVRYHAGFYPSGTAVSIAVGEAETIFNPTDPAVARALDRLSRQRDVLLVISGQRETIGHGRMARTHLQNILQRHARHLPNCRLDWAATLAEFTRPNLAAR